MTTLIVNGILANYGFCIKKSSITTQIIKFLENYFTVKPKNLYDDENLEDDTSFEVYYSDDKFIVIPKFIAGTKIKYSLNYNNETMSEEIKRIDVKEVKKEDEEIKNNIKYIQFKITKVSYKFKPINIEFKGKLREYQHEIIKSILQTFNYNLEAEQNNQQLKPTGGIIQLGCGAGKCLAKGTEILMFDGRIKLVESIVPGDILMGDDSTPRNVLTIARGQELMYKINADINNYYIVNESHILSLKNIYTNKITDISVKDYLQLNNDEKNNLYGYRVPITFNNKSYEVNPYVFGSWLADEYYSDSIIESQIFINFLKEYNINKNIHIPHHYKCNSSKIQLELLAGIIDSNNCYIENNTFNFINNNEQLINDIIFITRSLGFVSNKINKDTFFIISFYCANSKDLALPSKKNKHIINPNHSLNYRIMLEKLYIGNYYGFELDGNRRFLLGDYTVTHNTVLAIYLAHLLKLKTLIIVHQEFLQDQWIERFNMFTNARIGTIRQDVLDIENKDVVIGMVHSISGRDYPDSVFKEFGLVIYDETHHMGSRVFSRTLLKTSSRYNIGLSATPERSDGMMRMVKWFIGDVIYQMEKKFNYRILVKKIFFRSEDPLFKEKKRWIQGGIKPDHTKMLGNLINVKSRNNLMINIINTLKGMNRKIFVLSSRVEHLETLKNGVDKLIKDANESHIYNTYYYMGKSKKGERKMAEKDGDIIFATLQLAEEGLDISRLDSIIIALPVKKEKTLLQSIGRILRNDTLTNLTQIPVVIDISDLMSIYTKWSQKRDLVYNKKKWYMQHFYWDDENYLHKKSDDKNKKPMNIMFDDILDEDFIEKNLILTEKDNKEDDNKEEEDFES
jgi:superfamily II DNA or RNA helicase